MSKSKDYKRLFLLTFFDDKPEFEVKEINGFIIVKSWDGNRNRWTASIFTKESYKNMRPQDTTLF